MSSTNRKEVLDTHGLDTLWDKIKATFVSQKGGTVTGELNVSSLVAGSLLAQGDARFVNTIQGTIERANADGNGANIASTYLKLSGGTMTGALTLKSGLYTDSYSAGALHLGNSNIDGINSLYTADNAEDMAEGIHFYRDSTHVDSLTASGGTLYFMPNRTVGGGGAFSNANTVLHSGNYTSYAANKVTLAGTNYSQSGGTITITAANLVSAIGTNAVARATGDKDGNAIDTTYLKKSGGTMSGTLNFGSNAYGITSGGVATLASVTGSLAALDYKGITAKNYVTLFGGAFSVTTSGTSYPKGSKSFDTGMLAQECYRITYDDVQYEPPSRMIGSTHVFGNPSYQGDYAPTLEESSIPFCITSTWDPLNQRYNLGVYSGTAKTVTVSIEHIVYTYQKIPNVLVWGTGNSPVKIFNNPDKDLYGISIGENRAITGNGAVAIGYSNTASGDYSYVEGYSNTASGSYSHAEGNSNTASGSYSHAEGNLNTASGNYSHAEGRGNTASNPYETAIGCYNKSHTSSSSFGDSGNTLYSIGIGSSVNIFSTTRKNAQEVMQNGDYYIFGIGGYNGTNYASAKTLQTCITTLEGYFTNGVATTATNLANKPSLSFTAATSSSAGSTLTVTAGGKTSDAVTIGKVRSAFVADSATKATQDASGNVITSTYSTIANTVTALGTNGNSLTWTKNGTTNSITVPYATTAGSAPASDVYAWAKASSKPSYHAGELNVTPTSYKVTSVAAGIAPYISDVGTNIFSGATTAEIKVERSTDDGATWTDVTTAEEANVKNVFSGCVNGNLVISSRSKAVVGDKLRITFNPAGNSRYCTLAFIYIYFSTNGCGCTCNIEKNLYTEQTKWSAFTSDAPIAGWSGPNIIGMGGTIFGQGDSRNSGYGIRMTFRINSVHDTYDSRGYIYTIQGFTSNKAWGTPSGNSIAVQNTPYRYTNADRAVQFDNAVAINGALSGATTGSFSSNVTVGGTLSVTGTAFTKDLTISNGTKSVTVSTDSNGTLKVGGDVTATTFHGALSGNATTATTLQTSRTLWGQSFNGSANVSGNMTGVGSITASGNISTTAGVSAMGMYDLSMSSISDIATWGNISGNLSEQTDLIQYITDSINALPTPMQFKGSLGTGGTITALPSASVSNNGYTYKVITAGTYASQAAKVGDIFISNGSSWILVPSGDEPSGTVTSVGLSMPTGFSVSSSPVTSSGTLTVAFASGYSLPTTAKQGNWDTAYGWGNHASAGYLTSVGWANLTNNADSLDEGSSDVTDNTELFTSYASNNGFADTNAKGKVYRRDAVKIFNYVKGKLPSWSTAASKPSYAWSEITSKPSKLSDFTDDLGSSPTHTHSQYLTSHQDISGKVNKSGDTMSGLLTLKDGSNKGAKIGAAYITTASTTNGEVVLQGGHLRFGGSGWDYNVWAGLKYTPSTKTIDLGLADGTIFTANAAQTGGTLNLPSIENIKLGGCTLHYDSTNACLQFNF